MNYEFMGSPFEFDKFEDLSKKEAREYFEWYVNQIDSRMEILKTAVLEDDPDALFDYSPQSLIYVWQWYEKRIAFVPKSEEDISCQTDSMQAWLVSQHMRAGRKYEDIDQEKVRAKARTMVRDTEISKETLGYSKDIAIYFSEVMRRNHEDVLRWSFIANSKKHISFNKPVLIGFKGNVSLDSLLILEAITQNSNNAKNDNALFEAYNNWLDDLHD